MRKLFLAAILVLGLAGFCFAQENSLLIDSFEVMITGGATGTVDFGAGNGSSVTVTGDTSIVKDGSQSLKVVYDAVPGGYIWVARGEGLDAKAAQWLRNPKDIDWGKYKAIAFYMYGNDSKASIAFDLKDNGSEIWRYTTTDNFKGWKQIICPFADFYARSDWQPDASDKNSQMDFPIKSYQFEPLPESKGTLYFDEVRLIAK